MKYRDPISGTAFFIKSLLVHPSNTIHLTLRGIWAGPSAMETPYRYSTPALGVAGLGLLFVGAASLSPFALTLGALEAGGAAGQYLEVGSHLPPEKPAAPAV